MAIDRIGHINIRTPDFEATMVFFETVLGLVRGPAATMADQTRNGWLHGSDGRPIIHVNATLPGEIARPAGANGRLDHVAFDCSDQGGMAERLDRAGIWYEVLRTRLPGLVQFNLIDPNGIRVELTFGHEATLRPI